MSRPNSGKSKEGARPFSKRSSDLTHITSLLLSFFLLASFSAAVATASPQQKQETLRHEVTVTMKLLQVYVVDKGSKFVGDLNKEDFEIFENGQAKPVEHFERHVLGGLPAQTGLAATAATQARTTNRKFLLFIDCAFNSPAGVARAKRAALHFLEAQVLPTTRWAFFLIPTTRISRSINISRATIKRFGMRSTGFRSGKSSEDPKKSLSFMGNSSDSSLRR
jgi:hypothetical protein